MPTMWVVVANSSAARILAAPTPEGALEELECYAHPASRMRDQDIASDRPGRAFDSVGGRRHAMENEVGPKDQEAVRFAEQLAARLNDARAAGEFDQVILVAGPRFLGLLRERLGPQVENVVASTVDKDLAKLSVPEVRRRLPERLYSVLQ